jgi:UDP-N-acetylglucosamine 4,6-dehydratase/5-epimerase
MKNILLAIVMFCFFQISMADNSQADDQYRALFEGKNVLITGGTGYLGKTLAEAILKYNPAMIKIFSRDEVKLFNSQKLFNNDPRVKHILGDVRDYNSLLSHTKEIDLLIHTAALKRMDGLESNVQESVKTNILGSANVFNACVTNKVKRAIFISTDKACLPINVYGACKFVSEKIFTNYDNKSISTIFSVVRFGNILESTGSVIPIFAEKIKKGENITLTDPKMTRFIINKDEAVAFIFDAINYGVGGEIFIKYLPSLTLVDLIEVLKEKYQADNPVKIVGLRPGEKIHEVLINGSEIARAYEFNGMRIITPSLAEWLENLKNKNNVPLYIKKGNKLSENMKNYSSKNALISQDEIKSLFRKFSLY